MIHPRRMDMFIGRRSVISLRSLLFPLALFAFLLPSPQVGAGKAQDEDVERIESDLVVLNVTVTDGQSNYVHKIPRGEFKVFEDGVEQTLNTFAREENPFAAAILIDTSGSMESQLTLARAAAITFLNRLRTDDVVAVYHFHSKVEQLQDFSQGHDLSPVGYGLRTKGMTTLHDAVFEAAQALQKRPETRRAILVLSDGADTRSRSSLDTALNAAIAANATVYTVNMSAQSLPPSQRGIISAALRRYAEKSGGRFVDAPGGQTLYDAFEDIVEELSNQYTLGYRPSNRARDGRWRRIEVKLSRAGLKSRTRDGYRAPKS